ncbi:hypothetical protein [Microbaculum marinum]|uniref:Uncharacterized protein n=1 Tax=Microbaculum marinum TaxID=1764581 RepID=A0AAW9S0J1_9HYPH
MRAWPAVRPLAALAVGAFLATAGAVVAAPPFWGATYAYVQGPDDPANLTGGRPVHVAALLPGDLACTSLAGARLDDPPPYPRVLDSLRAAPVIVTLAQSTCPEPGENRWLYFVVPHPYQADILNLIYVTPDGKPLANQKVSISGGTGGRYN